MEIVDYDKKIKELKSKIKSFSDFPKKGILFWDIFSAISDGNTCKLLQNLLVETVKQQFPQVEAVIGLESRGFLFSFSLAADLGISCLPVRKKGKLPGEVISYKYDLEYGSDVLEIQKGVIKPGLKCLLIDDLIATGGSVNAATNLLRSCGAEVIGCLVVIELVSLNGRMNVPDGVKVRVTYGQRAQFERKLIYQSQAADSVTPHGRSLAPHRLADLQIDGEVTIPPN